MANIKITDLPELSETPSDANLLEIVDKASETPTSKKITWAVLAFIPALVNSLPMSEAPMPPSLSSAVKEDPLPDNIRVSPNKVTAFAE